MSTLVGRARSAWPELAVTVGLVAAVLAQAPGRLIRDTKLDLALDPWDFLSTSTHLWDPSAGLGQVGNQTSGFLFPMGPFFLLGDLLAVPPWITQRLWIGLLLVVAFWGALLLARALGIGSRGSRIAGAALYATAPWLLSLVGFQSGVQTPHALLPLVLVPLVHGSRGGSPRRAAAWSALAVLAMGGANAASVVAVLVLPVLWLATRAPGARRRALAGWWVGSVALATLWWTVPLLLQGRYGLDFLAYTEQADVTTSTTAPAGVLRGSEVWTSYLVADGRPWIPAGWTLATHTVAIAATSLVTALGLFGLARRDLRARLPLLLALAVGVVGMAAGWDGPFGGPLSTQARDLLDGPLAPLRNVHKLSPLVALPIALGFAHTASLLGGAVRRATPRADDRARTAALALVAAGLVVASAMPLTLGRLTLDGSFDEVADHWEEATAWLEERSGDQHVLLVPGASFGQYRWGRPFDEPIESVGEVSWAVRNLIPLGATGSTRLLDGVEQALATGEGDDGLAAALARSGIRYVVARNDLDTDRTDAPHALTVRQALARSAGLERVAAFGDDLELTLDQDHLVRDVVEDGLTQEVPPVEVFEVVGAERVVTSYPADAAVAVDVGPEHLPGLADRPGVEGRPLVDPDAGVGDASVLVADGTTRRDVSYGRVHESRSYVLTPDEVAPDSGRPVANRLDPGEPATVARYPGIESVRASSYANGSARFPETHPYAALDGDPTTAWRVAATGLAAGEWIELVLDEEREIEDLSVQLPAVRTGRARIATLEVATDAGTESVDMDGSATRQVVPVPEGPTRSLRLTVTAATGRSFVETAGVAEIRVDGLDPARTLVTPPPTGPVDRVAVDRVAVDPYDRSHDDEETTLDRTVDLGEGGTFAIGGEARARPGRPLLDELADRLTGATATVGATSTWNDLPELAPWHALDGDPTTAWLSDPANPNPALDLDLGREVEVDTLRIEAVDGVGRVPRQVVVAAGEIEREAVLGPGGRARFPAVVTDRLRITLPPDDPLAAGFVAVAEVAVDGLDGLTAGTLDLGAALDDACGAGPEVQVGDTAVPTRLEGTVGDLVDLEPMPFSGCEAVVADDATRLVAPAGPARTVEQATLTQEGAPSAPPPAGRGLEVDRWDATSRAVRIEGGEEALLVVNENVSDGWSARLDGDDLEPVTVDGWRQGFVVPAGDGGEVTLSFGPERWFRLALVVGLVSALGVLALALRRPGPETAVDPIGPRALPTVPAVVGAALALFLVAGPLALFVPLLRLLPSRATTLPVVAAAAYALVGALVAWSPGRAVAFDAGPQVLTALALAAVLAALDEPPAETSADPVEPSPA